MQSSIKNIVVWSIVALAFAWSLWFFTNYPETYPPAQEISQRCGEEEKNKPYCVGFSHGYDWAFAQMRMDEAMQEATNSLKDKVK